MDRNESAAFVIQAIQENRLDAALNHALQLTHHAPDFITGWHLLGNVQLFLGRATDAEISYRQALALDPQISRSHANLAIALLVQERYLDAWPHYEARYGSDLRAHDKVEFLGMPAEKMWRGESLVGKRFLLVKEQGYGDQIQFMRFASHLRVRGAASVSAWVAQPLKTLFASRGLLDGVSDFRPPAGSYDLWSPLLSIPYRVALERPQSPQTTAYLRAHPEKCQAWRKQLAQWCGTRPRIGLVWAGSAGNSVDARRSLPLPCMFDLLDKLRDAAVVSLQLAPAGLEQIEQQCLRGLIPLLDLLRDFDDTAAVIDNLDLVITVDTAVAHLAGALGKPVWVLLPKSADWRWGQSGETTPWYPSARLFRQPVIGDWRGLVAQLSDAAKVWLAER